MAAVSTINLNFWQCHIFCHSFRKGSLKCTPVFSVIRCYKGSARDNRRRDWNKKIVKIKRKMPKTFDYKQFMLTNYEKELFAFANRLGVSPSNPLLRTALIHKSFIDSSEKDFFVEHNSKLAVLGFNITAQLISEFLFLSYTNFPSYGLRSLHDYLVSRTVLVKVARSLSIPELIKTPYNLDSSEGTLATNISKEDIISDSILAVIGSIYVDEGSAPARAFVRDFIMVELYGKELQSIIKFKNPEISLAALLLQQRKEEPVARVISRSGKHTDCPAYVVGIFSSKTLLAKATSSVLEKAKQEAYCAALTKVLQFNIPQTPSWISKS